MTLEFALFDLDDTLYPRDALMPHIDARIEIFLADILQLSKTETTARRHYYNNNYGSVIRGLLQEETVDIDAYLDYVHEVPVAQYLDPNPQLVEVLKTVPLRKFIFTNSYRKHAQNVLSVLEIEDCFEAIFDIESVNFVSKPARQSYATVVQALDTFPEACVFVDDKVVNMKEPKAIGMKTILIDAEPDEYVDIAIKSILDIEPAIRQLL